MATTPASPQLWRVGGSSFVLHPGQRKTIVKGFRGGKMFLSMKVTPFVDHAPAVRAARGSSC
jgi:hypothetical protein